MSRQVLSTFGIQLTNLVATLSLFVSADLLHSSHVLSRHAVFCRDITLLLYSVLFVTTEEILSRQISLAICLNVVATHKTLSRHRLLQLFFFSSFLLDFSPF